jgi:hypothetical protein
MEHVTGEQLEAGSYDRHTPTATCLKCTAAIDADHDTHGISIDGEKYVCEDCFRKAAKIHALDMPTYFFASARFKGEYIQTGDFQSAQAALKRAAEMAEYCWGVESFVEVN